MKKTPEERAVAAVTDSLLALGSSLRAWPASHARSLPVCLSGRVCLSACLSWWIYNSKLFSKFFQSVAAPCTPKTSKEEGGACRK